MGSELASERGTRADADAPAARPASFDTIYAEHFAFVWRSARRLGVHDAHMDDVVQEVFVVVHRRLASFEGRSSMKTWLFGILRKVVKDERRTLRRKPTEPLTGSEWASSEASPHDSLARREAARVLHAWLDTLDDDKREAFVLAELEQMPMPEVAEALGVNLNTAYSRLRAARLAFEESVARFQAKDAWRMR